VFNEYQLLLEDHIETLVTQCGCSTEEFFQALKQDRDGETQMYVEIILAASEYTNFVEMMRSYKQKLASDAAGAQ
jgi:hypothetical protein